MNKQASSNAKLVGDMSRFLIVELPAPVTFDARKEIAQRVAAALESPAHEPPAVYPRVEYVRSHSHTCANVQGDGSKPCDCGAVVNGVAVPAHRPAAPADDEDCEMCGGKGELNVPDVEALGGEISCPACVARDARAAQPPGADDAG